MQEPKCEVCGQPAIGWLSFHITFKTEEIHPVRVLVCDVHSDEARIDGPIILKPMQT